MRRWQGLPGEGTSGSGLVGRGGGGGKRGTAFNKCGAVKSTTVEMAWLSPDEFCTLPQPVCASTGLPKRAPLKSLNHWGASLQFPPPSWPPRHVGPGHAGTSLKETHSTRKGSDRTQCTLVCLSWGLNAIKVGRRWISPVRTPAQERMTNGSTTEEGQQ